MDKQKIYQTLEEIFEHYKLVKQKYYYSLADSSFQLFGDFYKYQAEELIKLELFSKTLKLASYDKFPEIVDDKTYKNLPASSFEYLGITINLPELFRGVRNLDHHANLLCDKQYHYGVGDSCSGLHTAIHFDTALQYTNKDQSCILKLKLKNANIIDDLSITTEFAQVINNKTISDPKHSEFWKIFTTFVNNIQSETLRTEFCYFLSIDPSLIAIMLGYSAIYDHNFPAFSILDRGSICVSQSEYNRICKLTNHSRKPDEPLEETKTIE